MRVGESKRVRGGGGAGGAHRSAEKRRGWRGEGLGGKYREAQSTFAVRKALFLVCVCLRAG